jgi:hypothetical protein
MKPTYIYDFTDLDDETIHHPAIKNYQPTDGDLFVIRTLIKDKKIKRIRTLLDPEVANLEFVDVEGVTVSLTKSGQNSNLNGYCLAWNHRGGRSFPADSALRNGVSIEYEIFLKKFASDLTDQIKKS